MAKGLGCQPVAGVEPLKGIDGKLGQISLPQDLKFYDSAASSFQENRNELCSHVVCPQLLLSAVAVMGMGVKEWRKCAVQSSAFPVKESHPDTPA